MISARGAARAAVVAAMVLLVSGAARAETHAPWPTDWNNWNDPALWVTVGNPGNAADAHYPGFGAVAYEYNSAKYEVTAGQYTAFLNAVAKTDTYGLYNTSMWSNTYGCKVERTGSSGSYTYSVASDWANRPVNFVSWGDAARFANWLTNGQPTGDQVLTTTENGSYHLNGAISGAALQAVVRKSPEQGGRYHIPTEDEWYKAAYYNGASGVYYNYPTGSDSVPAAESPPGGTNSANFSMAVGHTTDVGAYIGSPSPYGTFDQGGNVFEWNEAILLESSRGMRGGTFGGIGATFLDATCRFDFYSPTSEFDHIGFRVSEVPEPASMALLALGGVGMLLRRRVAPRKDRP